MSNFKQFKAHYEYLQKAVQEEDVLPFLKTIQKRYRKYFKKLEKANEKILRYRQNNEPADPDTLATQRDLSMQLEELHLISKEYSEFEKTREEVKAPEPITKVVVDEKATAQAFDEGFAAGKAEGGDDAD